MSESDGNVYNEDSDISNLPPINLHSEKRNVELSSRKKEVINEMLTDLESVIGRKLTKKETQILRYIASRNFYHIGVTKDMLQIVFRITKDYAEKLLFEYRKKGLIVSSSIRKGRMMEYFLSNMQDYISIDRVKTSVKTKSPSHYNLDDNILMILMRELSNNKGLFHNIRLITELDDKKFYELLKTGRNNFWQIQSAKNKVKVAYTRLSRFRATSLQVSPNGTVEIYLNSSRNPYDLYSNLGLSELFVDLGKIENLFQLSIGVSLPLKNFFEWYVIRFDYNYDIEGLDLRYLSQGSGILQIGHLTQLFQFYTKQLPYKGLIMRMERAFSLLKPYKTLREFLNEIHDIEQS